MNLLQNLQQWGDRHHPKWLDIIRIALGVFLFYKGTQFMFTSSELLDLVEEQGPSNSFMLALLGHYIVFAHLFGGIFLVLGVLTRFACLIQIPILIGALVFINSSNVLMSPFSHLLIALLVLMLLIFFLIVGNGPISAYALMKDEK